jgi:predicted MFS family arabinose efflux permease
MVFYWEITEAVRPQGAAASALGWLWTFEGTAASIGSIIGGWISQNYSPKYCFAFMALCVFIGYLIINRGSKHLQAANKISLEADDALFHSKVPDVSS